MERRSLLVVPQLKPWASHLRHAGSLYTIKRTDDFVCVRQGPADSAAPVRRNAMLFAV